MLDLTKTSDPTLLKQAVTLLEVENERLRRRLVLLTTEIARLKDRPPEESLQQELVALQERLERYQKMLFGDRSERRHKETPAGGEVSPAPESGSGSPSGPLRRDGKPSRPGHGPTAQLKLPVTEVIHDLDEPDKICPECGGQLSEMKGQFEESEEIDVIGVKYVLRRHKCMKYRCACNACVETALGPVKLIPGGRYSIEFAVNVAVNKFLTHLPLARQVTMMGRDGLVVSDQTLYDQLSRLAELCEPTWRGIQTWLRTQSVVHVDETPWKLMKKGKTEHWWLWSMSTRQAVYCELSSSRSGKMAQQLLDGYVGVAVTDGLEVYETAQRLNQEKHGQTYVLAGCWSHGRRTVLAGEKGYAAEAQKLLEPIGKLFEVERRAMTLAREGPPGRSEAEVYLALLRERARLRAVESKPLTDEIKRLWQTTAVLYGSNLGRALVYLQNQWPNLTVFLTHPEVELTNNRAERELRGPVLGRVNFRGNVSETGARVTSVLYSLLQTAKAAGVDPRAYLSAVVRKALAEPGATLLPWEMAEA